MRAESAHERANRRDFAEAGGWRVDGYAQPWLPAAALPAQNASPRAQFRPLFSSGSGGSLGDFSN
jgi:hypothetical protein